MTVRNVIFADGYTSVATHIKHRTSLDVLTDHTDPANALMKVNYRQYYESLIQFAGLCNHATFDEREEEILKRRTNGDASENALLKFCHSNNNQDVLKAKFPEVACVSFNSTNKIMITIHKDLASSEYLVLMKGAPERVFERCTHYVDPEDGERKPLDIPSRQRVVDANTSLAANGERVLAFAEIRLKGLPADYKFETESLNELNFDLSELNFAGMISLEDPPRVEVPAAITCCHEAGIKVIMVTGDHPLTARSIAAQIGILRESDGGKLTKIFDTQAAPEVRRDPNCTGVVVTGNDLASLTEEDWDYILTRSGIVFARTLPAQKQEIVSNLQKKDYVVAVTGDGVNDSPALKKADVGVAMGSGSEIAKEAADLILIDDNFASIVKGIEEGRLIFSNLKKSIAYTLTSNIPEIVPFLAQIALQIPLGLTTILILVIDLGTDILPAISYAYEDAESDIMKNPPRNRHTDKLVTWQLISFSYLQIGVIQAFAAFTVFFHVLNQNGFSTSYLMQAKVGVIWIDPDETTCFENSLTNNAGVVGGCASYDFRMNVLEEAQTAFLTAIVICQIGAGFACKTRISSLFTHGITKNKVFLYGLCQEIGLICMVDYIGGLNQGFKTLPIDGIAWAIVLPFAVFLFCYDELRKFICRSFPDSEFKKYMFY
jgi:sodium/potassium-transporting ATPase subunit alpha